MSSMRPIWMALAMATAVTPGLSCQGSAMRGAEEPMAGEPDEPGEGPEPECCCERYDDNGNPTGVVVSDRSACKLTGGTCTEDPSQCESE